MKYGNPLSTMVPKICIAPNAGAAATTNGVEMVRGRARSCLVILSCGAIAADGTLDVKIQVKDSTGTWVDLYSTDAGGVSNQIKFTQKLTGDAGLPFFGWIPCAEVNAESYRAVGVAAVAAAPYAVNFLFTDFPSKPPSDAGEAVTVNAFSLLVGVGARAAALPH